MITVAALTAVGLWAAVWLAGVPKIRTPDVGSALLEGHFMARLVCAGAGAMPLTMLSVGLTGYVSLPILSLYVVAPAYLAVAFLSLLIPAVRHRALTGFAAGIVAVLAYDLIRLALSYSQGAGDPIPHIGDMLFGPDADWWWGYVWRTFGNGAGAGITFAMLCPRHWWGPWTGVMFGTAIGLGMLGLLALFPQVQKELFPLNWATVVNGFLGHWTYGAVLGWMARASARRRAQPPAKAWGRHARVSPMTRRLVEGVR